MHPRPVPVALDRLVVGGNNHAVILGNAVQQPATEPDLIGHRQNVARLFRVAAIADLKLPLARHHLGVQAVIGQSGFKAQLGMFFDDLTAEHLIGTDAAIIRPLRCREAMLRPAQRHAVGKQGIFLLEPGPRLMRCRARIQNGTELCAGVGLVNFAFGRKNLGHHQEIALAANGVGNKGHRLQNAVGIMAMRLPGRGTVKAPLGKVLNRGVFADIDNTRLRPQIAGRHRAVHPYIFCQCKLRHLTHSLL